MTSAPLTILYIDDTEADIELLRALLGQRTVRVDGAKSGRQGIAAYDPDRHAAAVIDWNLPDMDGVEVAGHLRAAHPACAIAFISGLFEESQRAAAHAIGIDRCFEKNMRMDHVHNIVKFAQFAAMHASKKAV